VWPPFEAPNYKISDDELTQLRALKFDFLRVTADPSIFLASDAAKREYLLDLVHRTVTRLIAAGFKVIFDLHPVSLNPEYAPLKLIESIDSPAFQAYAALMEPVARRLHDLPHGQFAFELMNEPWLSSKTEIARWQPMLELLHQRARAGSPTLPLVICGAQWSSAKALMQLDLAPFKGSNVLYTFHCYDPHTFSHQGVQGDGASFLSDLQWPACHDNIMQVQAAAFARIEATAKPPEEIARTKEFTRKLLSDYELTAHDRNRLRADFAEVAQWAEKAGIAKERIYLGEFGCVVSANKSPLNEVRGQWLRAMRETAEETGFAWAFWAYKGYGGMAILEDGRFDPIAAKALDLPL